MIQHKINVQRLSAYLGLGTPLGRPRQVWDGEPAPTPDPDEPVPVPVPNGSEDDESDEEETA